MLKIIETKNKKGVKVLAKYLIDYTALAYSTKEKNIVSLSAYGFRNGNRISQGIYRMGANDMCSLAASPNVRIKTKRGFIPITELKPEDEIAFGIPKTEKNFDNMTDEIYWEQGKNLHKKKEMLRKKCYRIPKKHSQHSSTDLLVQQKKCIVRKNGMM